MSKRLLALLCTCIALLSHTTAVRAIDWVAHASHPGPNQAPLGQSRFDELFRAADGHYRIPYPFEALLAQLESVVDNGRENGVRQVMIPLGRSLQRDAAAPDFFLYPRVVAALQGEPVSGKNTPQKVLEYRLFIAHQPQSHSLEIISYNDTAGRFEFQVVDDYRAGGQAQVRPANRVMCLSCHQNAGPIFATRPWRETNFDFRVARRLSERQPQRYESFVSAISSDADAIDLLTDRANYLAAAQLFWQRGCGTAACRAAALRALLQYRLSAESGFDREHGIYRSDYLDELQRNWKTNWPRGLALANSRIPDRDPFTVTAPGRTEDPLNLRPPHARWSQFDEVLADGIVFRLAGFLTRDDIRRIDRHLVQSAKHATLPTRQLTSRCQLAHIAVEARLLDCSATNASDGPRARIELDYSEGEVQSLNFLSLRLPGDPGILQPSISRLRHLDDGVAVELQNKGGVSMRLANGARLQSLRLRWQDANLRGDAWIELTVVNDFDLVDSALQAMLRDEATDSLSARPFRRRAVLADLGDAFLTGFAPKTPDPGERVVEHGDTRANNDMKTEQPQGDLVLLQAHCGHCHSADTRQPPGFLAGVNVDRRIEQCAPRILARLLAWRHQGRDHVVPMPPPAAVAANWDDGEHYPRLVEALEHLVKKTTQGLTVNSASDAYRDLDSCLAQD